MSADLTPLFMDIIIPKDVVRKLAEHDVANIIVVNGKAVEKEYANDMLVERITMTVNNNEKDINDIAGILGFKIVFRVKSGDYILTVNPK